MADRLTAEDAARLFNQWSLSASEGWSRGLDEEMLEAAPALAAALADSVPKAEHEAAEERIDILRAEVGLRTRERDEWEANEQEQAAEVTRLREALDEAVALLRRASGDVRAAISYGIIPSGGWEPEAASFIAALAEGSDVQAEVGR